MTTARILIVGAGIAGLTLAQALQRRGIPFDLIDRVEKPAPVGAGIMINYNALRLLDALGLREELRQRGRTLTRALIATQEGRVLQKVDALALVHRAEILAIHRADLHDTLSRKVPVRWGTTLTRWEKAEGGLTVTLGDGSEQFYSLVIGADGLDSSVRTKVFPGTQKRYAGYTCWRFVTLLGDTQLTDAVEWWGQGRRLGLVNIGQGRCYGYATLNAPAHQPDPQEGRAARLRELFREYPAPADALLSGLKDEDIVHHDLYELPHHHWYVDRMALIGDAAHAMTPNLGQGAGMGIEDAIVLPEALRVYGFTAKALATYAQARQTRVKTIADASRSIGLLGQLENPVLRRMRDGLFSRLPQSLVETQSRTQLFGGAPTPPHD